VAFASSTAIVDTDPNNNLAFNGNIQAEKLVAMFYMNPVDASAESITLTMTNMLVVTDAGNILPEDYSYPIGNTPVDNTQVQEAELAVTNAQALVDAAAIVLETAQAATTDATTALATVQAQADLAAITAQVKADGAVVAQDEADTAQADSEIATTIAQDKAAAAVVAQAEADAVYHIATDLSGIAINVGLDEAGSYGSSNWAANNSISTTETGSAVHRNTFISKTDIL
jgi:hypothetical protein